MPVLKITRPANYGKYRTFQFWKLHELPVIEKTNLLILVITKLTTFGNNKACQFWIQSKLTVLEAKIEKSIPQVKI